MSNKVQFRRGTAAERAGITLDEGEPGWDTDTKKFYIGDGTTMGGIYSGCTPLTSTSLTVAASDALHPERADYKCNGTDDDVEIQAANEAANGGIVQLIGKTFNLSSSITIDNCTLRGEGMTTTTLNITAPTYVQRKDNTHFGRLHDISFITSVSYTGTVIHLTAGTTIDETDWRGIQDILRNLTIHGQGSRPVGNIGILIEANASLAAHISDFAWCSFGPLYVQNMDTGIKLKVTRSAGTAFINSNYFQYIALNLCSHLLVLEHVHANTFNSVDCQHSVANDVGIELISSSYNIFTSPVQYDCKSGDLMLKLDANSSFNRFTGYYPFKYIDNKGHGNVIIDTYRPGAHYQYQAVRSLLYNGNMIIGNPPAKWTALNATCARETSIYKRGRKSLKVTSTNAWARAYQIIPYAADTYAEGYLAMSGYVRGDSANSGLVGLGIGYTVTSGWFDEIITVDSDDEWHFIEANALMPDKATLTGISAKLYVNYTGDANVGDVAYFDMISMNEGAAAIAYSQKEENHMVEYITTPTTALIYDEMDNTIYTNHDATGNIVVWLPQYAPMGWTARFFVEEAYLISIELYDASAIYINGAKQAGGAFIQSNVVGASVTLVADGAGDWMARDVVGTWTVQT